MGDVAVYAHAVVIGTRVMLKRIRVEADCFEDDRSQNLVWFWRISCL